MDGGIHIPDRKVPFGIMHLLMTESATNLNCILPVRFLFLQSHSVVGPGCLIIIIKVRNLSQTLLDVMWMNVITKER